jgi:hypothetical protein
MHNNMSFEITSLNKSMLAIKLFLIRTDKWSLLRMDSQMVKEVVPFLETLRTDIATQKMQISKSFWI